MRRIIAAAIIAAGSAAMVSFTIADAEAQSSKKRDGARPLTVQGRSFTNSGKHPLPGAEHRYVEQFTVTNRPVYMNAAGFGNNVMPGQFGAWQPR